MLGKMTRVGLLVLVLGCGESVYLNCTDIGCETGLMVELIGEFPAEFTLRVIPDSPAPWEVKCTPASCVGTVVFVGFVPESILIEIEANGTLLFQERFEPEYVEVFPNGPRCDDEPCLQGLVKIGL